MAYPVDGIPRPGLDVPDMLCPLCGHGTVFWMDGRSWTLPDEPLPHYHCFWCGKTYHAPYPKTSLKYLESRKKPLPAMLWRNA